MNNIFVLKVVIKLHEHNAIDFKSFFYEELTTIVIVKKMRAIKLLFTIDQDVNKLFFSLQKESLITIVIAHEYCDVVKLLMKKYDANIDNVESYFLYVALREKQPKRYLLDIRVNINYKREGKTVLINIIQFAFVQLCKIKKLTNIVNININKRDNLLESLFVVVT